MRYILALMLLCAGCERRCFVAKTVKSVMRCGFGICDVEFEDGTVGQAVDPQVGQRLKAEAKCK